MFRLQPTSADDLLKVLGFLKEYKIPFHIPLESVDSLIETLNGHNLEHYKDVLLGTPLEDLCVPKKYENTLLKPSSELKHFCGSEWVINGKYVTEEILLQRIEQYAKINHLKNGIYTQLDETLRRILSTDKLSVNDFELCQLFQHVTCSS